MLICDHTLSMYGFYVSPVVQAQVRLSFREGTSVFYCSWVDPPPLSLTFFPAGFIPQVGPWIVNEGTAYSGACSQDGASPCSQDQRPSRHDNPEPQGGLIRSDRFVVISTFSLTFLKRLANASRPEARFTSRLFQ